ncbi:FAD-dependent oxidoreductase [Flavihumibacter rivuli]|uniref:FAD-dependent oxidoreductase n=1 Tax=Flavihumibacter rivuli TaxID=2838156 RepID=UPI001BDE8D02|nr:FAD-dependent oxidoreductase [Flavihumibacter rivuli]ULQ55777.1 FAD-dependent oxidoreductase [Flavihumibacter rivuli]
MIFRKPQRILILFLLIDATFIQAQIVKRAEVLVIGGGTGGTAAGIQAARLKVKTLVVEPLPWLGGMLTAAGVSATDGNHRLPSGLWQEFRQKLYAHYGSPKALETGWVSNTQFEPYVGDSIWKVMVAAEKEYLNVLQGWRFEKVIPGSGGLLKGAQFVNDKGKRLQVEATIIIDATELGDVLANAGMDYDLGMEAGSFTGEKVGVTQSNSIVQDLTYVAILKDYGPAADCTIVKPAGYDPAEFDGACTDYYLNKSLPKPSADAAKLLDYGKLPNGKYMLNWPNRGNDTYLNIVEMEPAQRERELEKAKATTLRFVYFIQTQLGYKNLGLAHDEFPSPDRLALMPYHREGRRVKGKIRLTINHIADPYDNGTALYRTGISVGDYPIDHHHKKNLDAPQHLEFYPIPSYSVPLGAMLPRQGGNLIVAEKGISVSNVVNGTTRLQPVVLLTGQAAGVLAALAIRSHKLPEGISVRAVQEQLLNAGAFLLPFIDVTPAHPHFAAIQRIGVTGILQGKGVPYKWANQTWFYPDSTIAANQFYKDLEAFDPAVKGKSGAGELTIDAAMETVYEMRNRLSSWAKPGDLHLKSLNSFKASVGKAWSEWKLTNFSPTRAITRAELAVLLDRVVNPFAAKQVDHEGNFVTSQ